MKARNAVVMLACLTWACAHDFDVFEPTDDAGEPDAGSHASGRTGADFDAAAPPTASPPDSDAAPPVDAAPSPKPCSGATLGGHCYFVTDAKGSWDDGRKACDAAGAHLVTIASDAEEAAAASVCPATDEPWIGLSRPANANPNDPLSFAWLTGEPLTYQHWLSGEPNGGACARLKLDAGARGWADQSCSSLHLSVCERE